MLFHITHHHDETTCPAHDKEAADASFGAVLATLLAGCKEGDDGTIVDAAAECPWAAPGLVDRHGPIWLARAIREASDPAEATAREAILAFFTGGSA